MVCINWSDCLYWITYVSDNFIQKLLRLHYIFRRLYDEDGHGFHYTTFLYQTFTFLFCRNKTLNAKPRQSNCSWIIRFYDKFCDGNLWQKHKQLIFWIEQLSLIIQKSRKPDIICLLFTNKQHLLHISYNLCCCKNKFYEDGRIPTEFCTKYTSCAHKFDACRNME